MYTKNQRYNVNVLWFVKSSTIGYQTMQTWSLPAKNLHYVEVNAEGLTREILTDLINLVTKYGKASST